MRGPIRPYECRRQSRFTCLARLHHMRRRCANDATYHASPSVSHEPFVTCPMTHARPVRRLVASVSRLPERSESHSPESVITVPALGATVSSRRSAHPRQLPTASAARGVAGWVSRQLPIGARRPLPYLSLSHAKPCAVRSEQVWQQRVTDGNGIEQD
jgi:hypothetical protein